MQEWLKRMRRQGSERDNGECLGLLDSGCDCPVECTYLRIYRSHQGGSTGVLGQLGDHY